MEKFLDFLSKAQLWWQANAFPTQTESESIQLLAIASVGVFLLIGWLRLLQSRGLPLWVPVLSSSLVISVFALTAHLQRSFYGAPDMRCPYYEKGKLQFELLAPPTFVRASSGDPRDDFLVVLTVRAPDRWQDDVHFCALLESSGYTKALLESFSRIPFEGDGSSGGVSVSFTFGNGAEKPNVTWQDFVLPPEKGPPDVSPQMGDDA